MFDKTLRPTSDEIAGMIQAICRKKNWTRSFFAALVRIDAVKLRDYELGLAEAPLHVAFLIWLFYTLDTAPEVALSLIHIATWGKLEAQLPRYQPKKTPEELEAIRNELRTCVQNKYGTAPCRCSAKQLSQRYGISNIQAKRIAWSVGYKVLDGRKRYMWKKKRVSALIRPDSIWLRVDWRKKPREIAESVGVAESRVITNMWKFRMMKRATLQRHMTDCGLDPKCKGFQPIFNPPENVRMRISRAKARIAKNNIRKRNGNNIPVDSGEIISKITRQHDEHQAQEDLPKTEPTDPQLQSNIGERPIPGKMQAETRAGSDQQDGEYSAGCSPT